VSVFHQAGLDLKVLDHNSTEWQNKEAIMKRLIGITLSILCINLWSTFSSAAPQDCRYVSEGAVQQSWKKVRIQSLSGDVLGGADNFSEAIAMGQNLLDSQACRAEVQDCRMASEGIVGGVWMKHRIQMDGDMVFGADDMATALSQLSALRRLGFCQ
jgi:hypothetical protein